MLVDNKPGASGIVAFGDVRRTAPDGHTLYLADTATLAVNPLLHASLPYDPVQDLQPLTLLFRATFLLWVGARNRFATLAELMAAARRAPGQVSYATLGNGHASHVAVETFARAAGLHMLHVPFKDAGALMTSVVSGDVDFTTFSMNTVAGLYASGRLRPLAVAAAQRLAVHPEIPTLAAGRRPCGGDASLGRPGHGGRHAGATAGTAAGRPDHRAGVHARAQPGRAGGLRDHAVVATGAARAHGRRYGAGAAAAGRRPHRAHLTGARPCTCDALPWWPARSKRCST